MSRVFGIQRITEYFNSKTQKAVDEKKTLPTPVSWSNNLVPTWSRPFGIRTNFYHLKRISHVIFSQTCIFRLTSNFTSFKLNFALHKRWKNIIFWWNQKCAWHNFSTAPSCGCLSDIYLQHLISWYTCVSYLDT